MAEYISIDRIEHGTAACETQDRQIQMIPLSQLPPGIKEGDVLKREDGRYLPAPEEAQRRREKNRRLLEQLRNKNKDM